MGILSGLYKRTTWTDNKTTVNAERLNNIEKGISNLYDSAITSADIKEGEGVKVETTEEGKVVVKLERPIAIITEELVMYDEDTIYFLLSENGIIQKIIINGVASNYGLGL